jgi:hypothetical protein
MSPHEESFIVWVCGVTLNCWRLVKDLPVFAVLQASFYEKPINVSGEVISTNDLAYEEDFGLVVTHLPLVLKLGCVASDLVV